MAKYVSINELSTFVFHDSEFISVEVKDRDMIWYVRSLAVKKGNSQNPYDKAISIKEPKITINNYKFVTFYHQNTGYLEPLTNEELAGLFDDYSIRFSYFFPTKIKSADIQCGDAELILADSLKQFSIEYSNLIIEWDEYWGEAQWLRPRL